MSKMFEEIVAFFTEGTPMTPQASWFLMGLLGLTCVLIVLIIRDIDLFINLAIENVKLAGFKSGIWQTLFGLESYMIRKEIVIDFARKPEYGYLIHTTNGEESFEYHVLVVDTDETKAFKDAVKLSGTNEKLFKELKPDSRVRSYFETRNRETGETSKFYLVYLKNISDKDALDTMTEFFNERYEREVREAERFKRRLRRIA